MSRFRLPASLTSNALILLVSAFLIAFGNIAFFSKVLQTYPLTTSNAISLLSLVPVFGGATVLLLALTCFKRTTKPVLIGVLLLSSVAAYFMDSYGIVINDEMLQNIAGTDSAEARDLINLKLLAYLSLMGIAPAIWVGRSTLQWRGVRSEALARAKLLAVVLLIMVGLVLVFGKFYASFAREHKGLRSFANPTYYIYSALKYANGISAGRATKSVTAIGTDANIPASDIHRELIIMVIGEAARADRFSLNGYERDTNPRLRQADAVSFTNFWACGTSTAVSIPCMFSLTGPAGFSGRKAAQENVLDVMQRAGANVLWLDNNSDSKGVALRVPYQNYKSPAINPICDDECRDEGMLAPLQPYIDAHPTGDIFIVLHQMGNHGPAYFKRYPPAFERFKPVCRSNDLSQCSREEIGNAYDNAILYTDHFLGKVIELLKHNETQFEAAMLYVSDHGESLGEGGVYLHGLPNAIAPDEQLRVPAVLWIGKNFNDLNVHALRRKRGLRLSHSNLSHTVLGFLEIESAVYRPDLDILNGAKVDR